jgi:hypothetical protein
MNVVADAQRTDSVRKSRLRLWPRLRRGVMGYGSKPTHRRQPCTASAAHTPRQLALHRALHQVSCPRIDACGALEPWHRDQ